MLFLAHCNYGFNQHLIFIFMQYSNIITKLLNNINITGFLIKLNIWSLLNIKFFFFKTTSIIFYFLTNLLKVRVKFIKINNYTFIYMYTLFFLAISLFFIFLI
jgi:hypothetical protein